MKLLHDSAVSHKRWPRALSAIGRLVAVGVLAATALVPGRFLPGGEGIDVQGAFASVPVEVHWTGEAVTPYRVVVTMKTGLCDIVAFDARGSIVQWSAQEVTYFGRIQPGGSVKLVPRPGAEGYYHVRVGPLATWGPVLMATRVALLGMSAALAAAWLFGVHIDRRQWSSRRRREAVVVGATTTLTGLVLYSILPDRRPSARPGQPHRRASTGCRRSGPRKRGRRNRTREKTRAGCSIAAPTRTGSIWMPWPPTTAIRSPAMQCRPRPTNIVVVGAQVVWQT